MIESFQNLHPKIHESAFVADGAIIVGDVEIERNRAFGSARFCAAT
jgi:carbonic anhydrase/acetyltransferase-like protein (isoleucine patch superfamily)